MVDYSSKNAFFGEVQAVIGRRRERLEGDTRFRILQDLSRLDMLPTPTPDMSVNLMGPREIAMLVLSRLIRGFYQKAYSHSEGELVLPSSGVTSVEFVIPYDKNNRLNEISPADLHVIDMSKANAAYMRNDDLTVFHAKVADLPRVIFFYDLREIGYRECLVITREAAFSGLNFGSDYDLIPIATYLHENTKRVLESVGNIVRERYTHIFHDMSIRGAEVKNNPAGEWLTLASTGNSREPVNLYIPSSHMSNVYANLGVQPLKNSSFEYLKLTPKQIAIIATIIVLIFIVVIACWTVYKK